MPAVITITLKGNNSKEVLSNLLIVGNLMDYQKVFKLVSGTNNNPMIYYVHDIIPVKYIIDIIKFIRSDTEVNRLVKGIAYTSHLRKV